MSTYVPIQAITIGTATGSIEFTNIPQTYTDLIIVVNALQAAGPNQTFLRVGNNTIDTSSLYSQTFLVGNGTSAASVRRSNATELFFDYYAAPGISGDPNVVIAQFINYSNINTNKTILHRASKASNGVDAICSLWRSTSAINRIQIYLSSNNFSVGATFTLYGIGSGAPKAFGGSEVRTDGTYWYHTFRSSGQFTPTQALTADYLVIAGGGGGSSGGGGAGGYRTGTGMSLTANTSYIVTIGAGGTPNSGSGASTKGTDSIFNTITSSGGGRGGSSTGGSGGGADSGSGSTGNIGGYTPVEGFSGGNSGSNSGGGGGGAGGAGSNGGNNTGGSGGAGSNSLSTWATATNTGVNGFYAGGGGGGAGSTGALGGTGGSGGGGNGQGSPSAGGNNPINTAGQINTGSGGGGGWANYGLSGGSGIVIVRYAV